MSIATTEPATRRTGELLASYGLSWELLDEHPELLEHAKEGAAAQLRDAVLEAMSDGRTYVARIGEPEVLGSRVLRAAEVRARAYLALFDWRAAEVGEEALGASGWTLDAEEVWGEEAPLLFMYVGEHAGRRLYRRTA